MVIVVFTLLFVDLFDTVGCLVGVACQIPNYQGEIGDYDDLGYGIAVPVKYLRELIEKKPKVKTVPDNFFRDFDE